MSPSVTVVPVTQATSATFVDLYFRRPFLIFIRQGSKHVTCPINGPVSGEAGDVMIFPPGAILSMENRPLLDAEYCAEGVSFSDDLLEQAFPAPSPNSTPQGIRTLKKEVEHPQKMLGRLKSTLDDESLPPEILSHRLLEPLIWLKHRGISLSMPQEETPTSRLRGLFETDLSADWRAVDAAKHFAMSEATLRRWLSKSGPGFSTVLMTTRLEHGLALLQTTTKPITDIAFDCGFKTPSHFSDAFKKRFGIPPKSIRVRAN